jgi:hypothetical protein
MAVSKIWIPLVVGWGLVATSSAGLASEAFIAQFAADLTQGRLSSARSAASALLSTPITLNQLAAMPAPQQGQGAFSAGNYSYVSQVGAWNSASITQQGSGSYSVIAQQGQNNVARVHQVR